ncbi:MAG: lamin tail domain-containing protein [Candidatus Cloacimonadales bacterium]|nr:lamin tail domain-containing protein [Candidatus Cloacimonadales bacterium]
MKKLVLIISLLGMISFLFSQATELFISEYIEGSSYNKAIEIFNGTGAAVNLSEYTLEKDTNGGGAWAQSYSYSGILEDGDVFVLAHPDADPLILAVADDTDGVVINFNGNDPVRLSKNGAVLDLIGYPGGADFAKDVTLVRSDDVSSPVTTWNESEWLDYPMNTFTYLGYHVFQNEEPLIIVNVPNGGEQWEQGSTHTIEWTSLNFTDDVKIELEQVWDRSREVLVATTENDGEWEWTIPVNQTIDDFYIIRVSDAVDGDPSDESDNTFSIIEAIPILQLTIYEIQESQVGPSNYVGDLVETNGVVTAIFTNYFFIQDGPGEWNGIAVYPLQAVSRGDDITISGEVAEYMDKTEITNIINLTINGTASLPEAVTIPTGTLATTEEYESVLVKVEYATVVAEPNAYGEWQVDDGSGSCVIGGLGAYTYVPVLDDYIFSIKGVVDYTYGEYKLEPRDDDDINLIGLIIDPLTLNFFTEGDCINGLEFTISNLSSEDVTINDITDSGTFSSQNPWEIEDFSLLLPYELTAGAELTFNVIVGLPVGEAAREIVSDVIQIDSEAGLAEITLNFDTSLNVEAENNLVNAQTELIGNYPNPFNPTTTISFQVNTETTENTELMIYNLKGQKVKMFTFPNGSLGTSEQHVVWDGKDESGKSTASGLYFYKMNCGKYSETRKMLLLK